MSVVIIFLNENSSKNKSKKNHNFAMVLAKVIPKIFFCFHYIVEKYYTILLHTITYRHRFTFRTIDRYWFTICTSQSECIFGKLTIHFRENGDDKVNGFYIIILNAYTILLRYFLLYFAVWATQHITWLWTMNFHHLYSRWT